MTNTRIALAELPPVITAYLSAHRRHDAVAALTYCSDDIEITDEGRTYRGAEQVTAWMGRTSTEFTYTSEIIGAERVDEQRWVVTHRVVGNFPGSPVDLRFDITLADSLITSVTIAP